VVKGIGASPGQAQGRVCVLNSFRDFSILEPGNVIVCRTVLPSWSPLFSLASALVTDIGGWMSVGAIIARECGIPAVVATQQGTALLQPGELVYVDGDTGKVHRGMATTAE
jgi:pyruvate,water dikinase